MNIDYNFIVEKGCIPLIIAILTLGFPILLQTANRIDDKYNSTRLLRAFHKEKTTKFFMAINIFSLISIIIWFLNLPRIFDLGIYVNSIIDNSAFILVFLSTVLLIVFLFKFIRLIKIYFDPLRLFSYKERNMTKNKSNTFLELSDLLYYSIEQGNEELARELISFVTKAFIEFRKDKEGAEIIYPDEYYTTIFQANELVCIKPKRTVSYLNGSIFLNLLIDSYQKTIISDKTYNALWVGLRQTLSYDRIDIVMSYWKNAHQHFGLFLNSIRPNCKNKNGTTLILNQDEVNQRESERNKYFEFHLVLGGLLFFSTKFALLRNILNYTNQTPPVYHLIPGNLISIINNLLKIKEDYRNIFHYEQMYNFPDIDGINKGAIIRYWTKKYIAILFLRQYKLIEYYSYQNIFRLPTIPNSLSEMKEWEQELNIFKEILIKILEDNSVLESFELNELAEHEWYKKHNKLYPIDLLDKIILKVKEGYLQKKISQSISEKKEIAFYKNSKEIVTQSILELKQIDNKDEIKQNYTNFPLNGTCELLDKTAFSDDQDISYSNVDTIVAQIVSGNLSLDITWSFLNFIKYRYSFKPELIFKAIDKMGFDFNYYNIISFGVYLKHYMFSFTTLLIFFGGLFFFLK